MKNGLIINEKGSRFYYMDDMLHRTDGPAIEYANGDKEWFFEGKKHRVDGPAFEGKDGFQEWYEHGKLHRLDGYAVHDGHGSIAWYIHNKQYPKEEFEKIALMIKLNNELSSSNQTNKKIKL